MTAPRGPVQATIKILYTKTIPQLRDLPLIDKNFVTNLLCVKNVHFKKRMIKENPEKSFLYSL